jgi:hypothetical protein
MDSQEDHAPEAPPAAENTELDGKILAALRDATYGLTEDGILAVVAIRRYRAILSAIEDLILVGEADAERRRGVSADTLLCVQDFIFRAFPNEEQVELLTLEQTGPSEELVS